MFQGQEFISYIFCLAFKIVATFFSKLSSLGAREYVLPNCMTIVLQRRFLNFNLAFIVLQFWYKLVGLIKHQAL